MLETMFYALIVGAVFFMILTIYWESLVFGVLDVILWFIIAASSHSVEIPYTLIQSDNVVVNGVHEIQDLYILSMLFVLIGLIVLIYVVVEMVLPMFKQKFPRMM